MLYFALILTKMIFFLIFIFCIVFIDRKKKSFCVSLHLSFFWWYPAGAAGQALGMWLQAWCPGAPLSPPPSLSHNLAHIKCIVVIAKESLFRRSSLIAETTSYVPSENILLMHLNTDGMIPELSLKLIMMAAAVAHVNFPPSHSDTHTHTVSTPSPHPYFSSCFSLLPSSVNVHFNINVSQFYTALLWHVSFGLPRSSSRSAGKLRSMYSTWIRANYFNAFFSVRFIYPWAHSL